MIATRQVVKRNRNVTFTTCEVLDAQRQNSAVSEASPLQCSVRQTCWIDGGKNLDASRLQSGLAKLYLFEQTIQIVGILDANLVFDSVDFHHDFVSHRYFLQEAPRAYIRSGGTIRIAQDTRQSFPESLDWQCDGNSRSVENQRDAVSKQQYEAHSLTFSCASSPRKNRFLSMTQDSSCFPFVFTFSIISSR